MSRDGKPGVLPGWFGARSWEEGGCFPVSGADESGVPKLQLRGSGAGGGQCTSTGLEFPLGLAPQIQACSDDHLCPQRLTPHTSECALPALLAEILLRRQLSGTFLGQCWGLGWVVLGRAVRQTLPPALRSAPPPQWGAGLQPPEVGGAEAERVPKNERGRPPHLWGFPTCWWALG